MVTNERLIPCDLSRCSGNGSAQTAQGAFRPSAFKITTI